MIEDSAMPLPFGSLAWSPKGSPSYEKSEDPCYLSNVLKALNEPWAPLALQPSPVPSHEEVRAALAELANDTAIVERPERVWPFRPKHGAIADHRPGQEVGWPPKCTHVASSPSGGGSPNPDTFRVSFHANPEVQMPIWAPIPVVPIPRACFEVRACASPLPTALAESFELASSRWFDDEDEDEGTSDENKAPTSLVTLSNLSAEEDPAVLETRLGGKRDPFGVLHLDEKESSDFYSDDSDDTASPPSNHPGALGEKGWARLRPPVINMHLVRLGDRLGKESHNIPSPPGMRLPTHTYPPAPLGSIKDTIMRALVPVKRHSMLPLTPTRLSLLNILNGR